jgi:hypothetical protein
VSASGKRWAAKVHYNSKHHTLGSFDTKQEAALAYDRWAKHCSEDRPLNYESIAAAEEAAMQAEAEHILMHDMSVDTPRTHAKTTYRWILPAPQVDTPRMHAKTTKEKVVRASPVDEGPQLSLSEGLQRDLCLMQKPDKGSPRRATWQCLQQRVAYLQQVKPCVLGAGSAQDLLRLLAQCDQEKLALGEATNSAKLANASDATKQAPLAFKKEDQSHATWTRRQHACRKYFLTWTALPGPGLTACTVGGTYTDLQRPCWQSISR